MRQETELVAISEAGLEAGEIYQSYVDPPARAVNCEGFRDLRIASAATAPGTLKVIFSASDSLIGPGFDIYLSFPAAWDAISELYVVHQIVPIAGQFVRVEYINGEEPSPYFRLSGYLL